MSESLATATGSAKPNLWMLLFRGLPYIALYIVTVVLVAMTDSEPEGATELWAWFMPVVALVSVIGGWGAAGSETKDKLVYIGQQVLYWGTLLLVLSLLFMGDTQHFLNAESQGFFVAILLGYAALASGIHWDWKMAFYGAFVIASAIGIAFLDDNAVLISVGGIAVAGIAITVLLRRKKD